MKSAKLKMLFPVFFTLFIFNLYAQENKTDDISPKLKKNAIYGTVGVFGYAGIYNINAERILWDTDGFIKSIRARFGGGEWVMAGFGHNEDGIHFISTINTLTGARVFHFEMNLGTAYIYNKTKKENYITPAAALGIRLQKPGSYFLFRLGAGFPEAFYLSLGVAF